MQGAVISCMGLCKGFDVLEGGEVWRVVFRPSRTARRRVEALRDVTLDVPKGEFVGVIGRNGAGKSTLLRTLGGVYPPDRGSITIRDELFGLYELGLAGNRMLSGRDYAERILTIVGATRGELPALLDDIEEFSELGDRLDDPLFTYSAGMTARLFFATATARPSKVYLIDEILAVGDQHFQAKCWRRLRDRLDTGASGILVTHDWSAVLKICKEAHILDRGRVVRSGPSDEVVRSYLAESGALPTLSGEARFVGEIPERLLWRAGEDAVLPLTVEIIEPLPVHMVFAIERMTVGVGWEVVLNATGLPVAAKPGRHRVDLEIPSLPLAPGEYMLDVTLVWIDPDDYFRRRVLDGHGWLKDRPIRIIVEGAPTQAQAVLPLDWRLVDA